MWSDKTMVEAIIFDKDGTLIDFDSFWLNVTIHVIKNILKKLDREDVLQEELFNSVGVKNGVVDKDGILCKGTYEQIAIAFNSVFKRYGYDTIDEQFIVDEYSRSFDKGEIKPICENIKDILIRLKENNIKLAVVTTDNYETTCKCLKKLEIFDLFEKVYTDDGVLPVKPDPYCAIDFSILTGIERNKIMMVGDTMTDVCFAKNAGISVTVVGATSEEDKQLIDCSDAAIPDVSHIFDVIQGA